MTKKGLESIFWSIALPGFPQLMNGKLIKGILFIGLGILINVQSNFNTVIILSFQGAIEKAIAQTNYQWLMFYPCLYFFSMWDAYRDVEAENSPFMFIPFVFSAYFVTVGVIYSSTFTIKNILLGPIWLSFLCLPIGLLVGMTIKNIILWKIENSN